MANHLVSTTVTEAKCQHCGKRLLTALDEGLQARVDATPLPNPQAEIDALLDGRRTYVHTTWHHLVHRDATRIAGGQIHGPIHAEHRCVGTKQLEIF